MTTTTGEASAHGYHKDQHEEQASSYTQYDGTRLGLLEHQLQEIALENCEGITVLDLGDGHGLRARHAIELGAKAVDRVDCKHYYLQLWSIFFFQTRPSPLIHTLTFLSCATFHPPLFCRGGRWHIKLMWTARSLPKVSDLSRNIPLFSEEATMNHWSPFGVAIVG